MVTTQPTSDSGFLSGICRQRQTLDCWTLERNFFFRDGRKCKETRDKETTEGYWGRRKVRVLVREFFYHVLLSMSNEKFRTFSVKCKLHTSLWEVNFGVS